MRGNKAHPNLRKLAQNMREVLDGGKKSYLVFAHNGTGKTRLSCAFKDIGKKTDKETDVKTADTLYYNAFTEDLFTWNNDLDSDVDVHLRFNKNSRFFSGLDGFDIERRIRELLGIYANFSFRIHFDEGYITFSREILNPRKQMVTEDNIKISRGEESIFIWCFFLAVAQLAIEDIPEYSWVNYIYIDDPISSLDDNNVVAVACHLARLLKDSDIKTVISTHHTLFFNVMYNELKWDSVEKRFLDKNDETGKYITRNTGDTPFFHHVALLQQLRATANSGKLYTYHFNVLRNILEKTAAFHGFDKFSACIKQDSSDIDGAIHLRMTNLLSHGGYSIFEPLEMVDDNKRIFKEILDGFMELYKFNEELFQKE
ncbi:MAG: AAA family ATPase [Fibromonadaceae bacterium]|jgi:wobble nucleotide-excising tRNase|nr:AAA family ATPase [Fibromonadaceae bacterium]